MFYINLDNQVIQIMDEIRFVIAGRFISKFYRDGAIPFPPQECKFTKKGAGKFLDLEDGTSVPACERWILQISHITESTSSFLLKLFFPINIVEQKSVNNEISFAKFWHSRYPNKSLYIDSYLSKSERRAGALLLRYINGVSWTELNPSMYDIVIKKLISDVKALHSLGYSHGDIAMKNVIVTNEGELFLIDFEDVKEGGFQNDIIAIRHMFSPIDIERYIEGSRNNGEELTDKEISNLHKENIAYTALTEVVKKYLP